MLRYYNRLIKMDDSRIPKHIFRNTLNNEFSWAGKTKKLMESLGLDIYWTTRVCVPSDLLHFYIKEKYKETWNAEIAEKPKLRLYRQFKKSTTPSIYVSANLPKPLRSLTAQLCCGVLKLRVEMGHFENEKIDKRTCQLCDSGEVETELHFLYDCKAYKREREEHSQANGPLPDMETFVKKPFRLSKYLQTIWRRRNVLLAS